MHVPHNVHVIYHLAVVRDPQSRIGVLIELGNPQTPVIDAQSEPHCLTALEAIDDDTLWSVGRVAGWQRECADQTTRQALDVTPSGILWDLAVNLTHVEDGWVALLSDGVDAVIRGVVVELELTAVAAGGDAFELDKCVGETACSSVLTSYQHLVLDWMAWLRGLAVDVPKCRQVLVYAGAFVQRRGGSGSCESGAGKDGGDSGACEVHVWGFVDEVW
jgi:hypothetical protein